MGLCGQTLDEESKEVLTTWCFRNFSRVMNHVATVVLFPQHKIGEYSICQQMAKCRQFMGDDRGFVVVTGEPPLVRGPFSNVGESLWTQQGGAFAMNLRLLES